MPRKRPEINAGPNVMDANQVVAFNFRLAREARGWTQEEVAAQLEPHLGQRLKNTSVSAIERSVASERRRVFTVQEVVAFALAFQVPFIWFLVPPAHDETAEPMTLAGHDGPLADLWEVVVGRDADLAAIRERLKRVAEVEPDEAHEMATRALGFGPTAPWDHFVKFRHDSLVDFVAQEYDSLTGFMDEMQEFVDRYQEVKQRMLLVQDVPRRAYRNVAAAVIGERVWHQLNAESGAGQMPHLLTLMNRDDVPWDHIIDLEDEAVREALLNVARVLEPAAAAYVEAEGDELLRTLLSRAEADEQRGKA